MIAKINKSELTNGDNQQIQQLPPNINATRHKTALQKNAYKLTRECTDIQIQNCQKTEEINNRSDTTNQL